MLLDLSSVQSDAAGKGAIVAGQMAVDDFGGKLMGRPIELLSADHQLKPDIGSSIARRWIDEENIDAFVEVQNSAVAVATLELARKANKTIMFESAGSTDLTGKLCTPVSVHWTWDGYQSVKATSTALLEKGLKSWFFLTPDYNFGKALSADARRLLAAEGGQFVGEVMIPTGSNDYSSALLQAQASHAQVIANGTSAVDAATIMKQAAEFGIINSNQRIVGVVLSVTEIESVGLQTAQGTMLTETFYWDLNDETRAWTKRFREKSGGRFPNQFQAGVYGAVTNFLKAAAAAGTTAGDQVVKKMRELPINDLGTKNGRLREDGRIIRDVYLFEVKSPKESKYDHDFYKLVATIPGDQAFKPLSESECPLVKH
jgi:branched-chain amino acid transport system substrate-binding protein